MEFFSKTMAVTLRSHHDKYLVADDDLETVRQSRNGSNRRARWAVEMVQGRNHVVRLRSCHGTYLTATDIPFLLGMTGKRVQQAAAPLERAAEWEPMRDGVQVRLRSWCGKLLRANGGAPPWRDSITHDEPHRSATQRWVFWDVEAVEVPEMDSLSEYLSTMSSFSSVPDELLSSVSDEFVGSQPGSPVSTVKAVRKTFKSAGLSIMWTHHSHKGSSLKPQFDPDKRLKTGMEVFRNAKTVRLRSHHNKYLHADSDEESVTQDGDGVSKSARWTVEIVQNGGTQSIVRLRSCHGRYLTASDDHFLLGMTGRKVLQTVPARLDSSVEWEPIREGPRVRLKTRYGNFLRANGGVPPWRNSVTHDVPHRTVTQDWVLWDVDVVEILAATRPLSIQGSNYSRQETSDSIVIWQPKPEGRIIYYKIANDDGDVDEEEEEIDAFSLTFKGNAVEELTQKLKEETGLEEITVCSRSPLNGELCPLRLQLPPNTTTMRLVVVPSSSSNSVTSLVKSLALC